MKTTLNITLDTDALTLATAHLDNDELARLMRALTACALGEEGEQYLNTSGLRLAFALLSPPIAQSVKRVATLRANGAKGGRPRKQLVPAAVETQNLASPSQESAGFPLVSSKKSKKEDLSPTPPIEEKNKKNNIITPSQSACAREEKQDKTTVPVSRTVVLEWEELQRQMLQEQPWLDELCMSRGISREDMEHYIADFIKYLRDRDLRETLPHAKAHFVNQLPYIVKIYNSQQNHENNPQFIADPVARRQSERESRRQAVCRAIAGLAAQGEQPACHPF